MNLEQAVVDAIGKVASRKNGAALVAIGILYAMNAPAEFILYLAGLAILLQFLLDIIEVLRTGRDLPDSGATNGEKPPILPAATEVAKDLATGKWEVVKGELPMKTLAAALINKASAPEETKEAQVG